MKTAKQIITQFLQKGGIIARDNTATLAPTKPPNFYNPSTTPDVVKQRSDFKGNFLSNTIGKNLTEKNFRARGGPGVDFYANYYGLPTKSGKLQLSAHKPTNAKDQTANYYSLNDNSFRDDLISIYNSNPGKKHYDAYNETNITGQDTSQYSGRGKIMDKVGGSQTFLKRNGVKYDKTMNAHAASGLGRLTMTEGKDSTGNYLSYYDVFDEGSGSAKSPTEIVGATKPFEIYDRIYVDKDANGKLIRKPNQPKYVHPYKTHNEKAKANAFDFLRKK